MRNVKKNLRTLAIEEKNLNLRKLLKIRKDNNLLYCKGKKDDAEGKSKISKIPRSVEGSHSVDRKN